VLCCTNHTWSTPKDSNALASQTTKRDDTLQRARSMTSCPVDDTIPHDAASLMTHAGVVEMER